MTGMPDLPASIVERTVPQLLDAAVERDPDRVALIGASLLGSDEEHVTYADLAQRARRLAATMEDRGVGRGDRVCIMLANDGGIEAHVSYHASHHLGAVNVPVNTRFVGRELRYAIEFAEPAAIIFGPQFAELVESVVDPRDPPILIRVGEGAALGDSFGVLLNASGEERPAAPLQESDDADWIFTSGTTGNPKAVALTHANSVACGHEAVPLWGLERDSVYQNYAPFFTSSGCHTNLLPCLVAQCTYVVEPEFKLERVFEQVLRHGSTSLYLLSSFLVLLLRRLDDGRIPALEVGRLERLCYGGQTMPREFHERVQRLFTDERGVELVGLYGLTEGGTSGLMFGPEDHAEAIERHGSYGLSVGRRGWNDWIQHRIVGDNGEPAEPGEVGELHLRAPSVMSRYVANEEATREVVREGWLRTGDLMLADEAGFVYFVGRRKQMIRRSGLNISAAEVEGVALSHSAVAEAVAVPRPNPVLGEDVHLVVVLAVDSDPADESELIAFCSESLADYKVPRSIAFTDALPRNANGRVVRAELGPDVLPWLA